MKNSFILYTENREQILLLSKEQRADLLLALFDYAETGETEELDALTQMAFSVFRAKMDRDAAKYEEVCQKRRDAASKGGKQKVANATKSKQKVANATKSKQKGYDTDPDPEPDNESPTETDKRDTRHKHGQYKHVLLTDAEYERLIAEFGADLTAGAIKAVDEYCQGYGKRYTDYNLVIRKWGIDSAKEKTRAAPQKPKNSFHNFQQRPADPDLQRQIVAAQRARDKARATGG